MRYQRTYHLQASHFNRQADYDRVWGTAIGKLTLQDFFALLRSIHGHNFKIVVVLEGSLANDGVGGMDWLIDDVELAKIVMAWDNMNISMHSDFMERKMRATTERMAFVLFKKLLDRWGPMVKGVTVYETDDIFANAGELPA